MRRQLLQASVSFITCTVANDFAKLKEKIAEKKKGGPRFTPAPECAPFRQRSYRRITLSVGFSRAYSTDISEQFAEPAGVP